MIVRNCNCFFTNKDILKELLNQKKNTRYALSFNLIKSVPFYFNIFTWYGYERKILCVIS